MATGDGKTRSDEGKQAHPAIAPTVPTPTTELAIAATVQSSDATLDSGVKARASTEAEALLARGAMVGEYRVEGMLGAGGMGVVFSALHPVIGKKAAIKVLRPSLSMNAAAVERFVQEARAVNQIGHPNIVDVFAFGSLESGESYFVMEWLQGESLQARLKRKSLTLAESIPIIERICDALSAAHEAGIVHRDLKPDNVFLVETRGGPPQVKLLDFGIAKLTGDGDLRTEKTATGHFVGTPLYMSPEQARGQDVDGAADVYSLGAMIYEMVGGRPPFVGESAMDVIASHLHDRPVPLITLAPEAPSALAGLVEEMLAKPRAARPGLAEVMRSLDAVRGAAGPASPADPPRQRSRGWLAAAVLGAALLLGGGVMLFARGGGASGGAAGVGAQAPMGSPAGVSPAHEATAGNPTPTGAVAASFVDAGIDAITEGDAAAAPLDIGGAPAAAGAASKPSRVDGGGDSTRKSDTTRKGGKLTSSAAKSNHRPDAGASATKVGGPDPAGEGTKPSPPIDDDGTVDPFAPRPR